MNKTIFASSIAIIALCILSYTPPSLAECDYASAGTNAGWGWDPIAMQSCPPVGNTEPNMDNSSGGNCDYSNAASNSGWGWDPVAMQSCPPGGDAVTDTGTGSNVGDNCDYSNAAASGGWGWDPIAMQSCPPDGDTVTDTGTGGNVGDNCDYSNAASSGGWGWDPVNNQSCPPTAQESNPLDVLRGQVFFQYGHYSSDSVFDHETTFTSQSYAQSNSILSSTHPIFGTTTCRHISNRFRCSVVDQETVFADAFIVRIFQFTLGNSGTGSGNYEFCLPRLSTDVEAAIEDCVSDLFDGADGFVNVSVVNN